MRINAIPPTILFSVFFLLLASVFAQAKVTTTVRQTSEFSSTFSGDDGNDSSSEMGNFHALDGSDVTRGARGEITASNESTETESEMEVEAAESMEPEMAFPFGQASEAAVNMSFDGPRGRIVGGKEATVFVRRHLVLISIQDRSGNVYSCTGTILARKWVLSAAHCFDSVGSSEDVDEDETYVYISPRVLYPSFATRRFYIRNAFVHNGYAGNNYDLRNDIALVELWDTIPQSKYAPVRIGFEPRPRKTVLAAGYGVINEQGDEPRYAQQANLLSMDYGTCRRSEREEDRDFLERKTNVCAVSIGFPDKGLTDTCYGDSGGPLFNVIDGKLYQYGITSYSTQGCAERGSTPWYTRVSNYRDTIDRVRKRGRTSRSNDVNGDSDMTIKLSLRRGV